MVFVSPVEMVLLIHVDPIYMNSEYSHLNHSEWVNELFFVAFLQVFSSFSTFAKIIQQTYPPCGYSLGTCRDSSKHSLPIFRIHDGCCHLVRPSELGVTRGHRNLSSSRADSW